MSEEASSAPRSTKSPYRLASMSEQERSRSDRRCSICGITFRPRSPNAKKQQLTCSKTCGYALKSRNATKDKVKKPCAECGKTFTLPHRYHKRRFCSVPCANRFRYRDPAQRAAFRARISAHWGCMKGRKNPSAADNMRKHNPMRNPEARAKMARSLKGRTFLARGGKGKLTLPQTMLAEALGLPTEHVIKTAPVREKFVSLPSCYMVDIADPQRRLAIEVDGKTHRLRKWRFLDKRKTEVLNALGWSVLRFSNEEILTGLPMCIQKVHEFTT